uniref:Uncharacterized protein n=1 Tax=Lotharella vacuolata TaxID=74820 RepID=A0A0H5BQT7_9EUKA|nr:hypothetical protein [Lotharella vacuolata]
MLQYQYEMNFTKNLILIKKNYLNKLLFSKTYFLLYINKIYNPISYSMLYFFLFFKFIIHNYFHRFFILKNIIQSKTFECMKFYKKIIIHQIYFFYYKFIKYNFIFFIFISFNKKFFIFICQILFYFKLEKYIYK